MWEKELELIESLGKLYPEFIGIEYKHFQGSNFRKSWWVYDLCRYHLKRRLPYLEIFMISHNVRAWSWYKEEFEITNEQCGKKS